MTLHLVALPHTRVAPEFCGCAYTAKALKFCRMMGGRADVVLYAPEGSSSAGTVELVECLSEERRVATFGPDDPGRLPAWPSLEQAAEFNATAALELRRRYEPGDLVLLTGGATQAPVIRAGPAGALCCEPGVGYEGLATGFAAFESYAWRHYVYGKQGIADGRWFDTVIPNYFDLDEFPAGRGDGDYLLFLGRVVPRKGPQIALEVAEAAGLRLVVAGAGARQETEGVVVAGEGTADAVRLEGDVTYAGPVGIAERAALLGGAAALLAPTTYVEPFGGVAVEAMLCGTPAVTTDWGAFTETVEPGVTGFRFATLREGAEAVAAARTLDRELVRRRAAERYSLEAVAPQFLDWFGRLDSLWRDGWYEKSEARAIMGA